MDQCSAFFYLHGQRGAVLHVIETESTARVCRVSTSKQ
jgi:hypothetical protein